MKRLVFLLRFLAAALGLTVALAAAWATKEDARQLTGMLAFLFLAGLGILLSVSALLPNRLFARLAAPPLTLLIPLLAFEIINSLEPLLAASSSQDPRSKRQMVEELRKTGAPTFPAAFPTLFFDQPLSVDGQSILPLSGAANVETVLCQEALGWAVYPSDRFGFNNPDTAWQLPDQIVVLGDSFVHGACLPPEATFTDLIRQRGHATLNLGMSDDGPLLMLATLLEYESLLHPKTVVWAYYDGNDLYRRDGAGPWRGDIERESAMPILRAYLEIDQRQRLPEQSAQINLALKSYLEQAIQASETGPARHEETAFTPAQWRRLLSLQSTLGMIRHALYGLPNGTAQREDVRLQRDAIGIEQDLALLSRVLAKVHSHSERKGSRTVFLYLPSVEEFSRSTGPHPLRSQVLELAEKAGFEIVDMEEIFRRKGDIAANYAFGMRGGHFSPLGHRRVADALLTVLSSAGRKD